MQTIVCVWCPLHVGRWFLYELIRLLTGLVFSPAGLDTILLLDADYPSMRQVVIGYNVTSSRVTLIRPGVLTQ